MTGAIFKSQGRVFSKLILLKVYKNIGSTSTRSWLIYKNWFAVLLAVFHFINVISPLGFYTLINLFTFTLNIKEMGIQSIPYLQILKSSFLKMLRFFHVADDFLEYVAYLT